MFNIPDQLRKNVCHEWGKSGETWLEDLPPLVKQCQELWNLELENSSFDLSYNFVTAVRMDDGRPAILKVGYPHEELFTQMKLLTVLNGHCSAQLLHSSEALGAMLLERIQPGTVLNVIQRKDDEEATRIAADLLRDFPRPVPADFTFPTLAEWTESFERAKGLNDSPLSLNIIEKAQSISRELEQSKESVALLHGDLHHGNILFDHDRGWLSIDPQGVIGDPVFNAARFINDPRPGLIEMNDPQKIIARRLEILSSILQADKARLLGWAYVDCILSACWWVESGGQTANYSLRCAEIFDSLVE